MGLLAGEPLSSFRVSTITTRNGAGPECLYSLVISTPVATSVIKVFNGTTAGRQIAQVTVPASPMPVSLVFGGVRCESGICIDVSVAASDLTVSYF